MTINYFYYSPFAVRYGAALATFSDTVAGMHTNKVVRQLCAGAPVRCDNSQVKTRSIFRLYTCAALEKRGIIGVGESWSALYTRVVFEIRIAMMEIRLCDLSSLNKILR